MICIRLWFTDTNWSTQHFNRTHAYIIVGHSFPRCTWSRMNIHALCFLLHSFAPLSSSVTLLRDTDLACTSRWHTVSNDTQFQSQFCCRHVHFTKPHFLNGLGISKMHICIILGSTLGLRSTSPFVLLSERLLWSSQQHRNLSSKTGTVAAIYLAHCIWTALGLRQKFRTLTLVFT